MRERPRDPWLSLAALTPARIALGRAGASLPTREVLSFALAHAQARDAVHAGLDRPALARSLAALGLATVEVESEADGRDRYLARPDLGRRLAAPSRERLESLAHAPCDLCLMVGDGLSATAVAEHSPALIGAFLPHAARLGLKLAAVVIARGARVALGDDVALTLNARAVAVLIGERPGLSAADSLGIYLTYGARPGMTDAQRNCISNVRPLGLAPSEAAARLAWLVEAALSRGITGVDLKDESDALSHAAAEAPTLPR
ncbi:MAG: ethanolamine ammonia-lyase subunit EutC [Hyphomicrobiaceae bacterium]|nr:ethanolamine ammonia-lyase subunit EutC [Hyphomicrobiaceae bacterium]